MPNPLAVLSSAERLWPHDTATDVVFGVNLVTAMLGSFDPGTDLDWLAPWRWDALANVAVWGAGLAIPATLWSHPAPVTGAERTAAVMALERRLTELYAASGAAPFRWNPADPSAPPPEVGAYREILAAAGTGAGALAHGLNLAFTVRVRGSDIPGATWDGHQWTLPTALELILVPHLRRGVVQLVPEPAGPSGTAPAVWRYGHVNSAPATSAYTLPVNVRHGDVPTRYFRLESYWVVTPGDATLTDPGDDWTSRLGDRVADAWNLPRHLLDAASLLLPLAANDPNKGSIYRTLWDAILATLRDRAGAGLNDTPDGRGLFRLAADQALPRPANPVEAAVRDGRIESLRERGRVFDRQVTLDQWQGHLIAAVPALAGRLPLAAPVPAGAVGPDEFAPITRAVVALQDEATLTNIVGRQWEHLVAQVPELAGAGTLLFGPMYTRGFFDATTPWAAAANRWHEVGALDLTGRDSWAVTLGAVTLHNPSPQWEPGPVYQLELPRLPADGPHRETLIVRVTYQVVDADNKPALKVELIQESTGAALATKDVTFARTTVSHQLRVLFTPTHPGTTVAVKLRAGESGVTWQDGPTWTPPAAASALSLTNAAARVRYEPAASAARLQFVPPTVLSAAPARFDDTLTAWDDYPIDTCRHLWDRQGEAMKAAVRTLQPRRRLALGQTARLWPIWNFYEMGSGDVQAFLAARVRDFLPNLACHRLGWPNPTAPSQGVYADFAPTPATAPPPAVQATVNDSLWRFTENLLASDQLLPRTISTPGGGLPTEDDADRIITRMPHAWNVAIDRPGTFTEPEAGGEDEDLTRRVAGVGLLLRQAAPTPAQLDRPWEGQPWRVLNAADVLALTTPASPAVAARRMPIPIRGRYQDEARQTVVSYDNQPLAAASPLAGVSTAKKTLHEAADPVGVFGPFRYVPATRSGTATDPCGPLPALKFGQLYQLTSFLIGNNGALPKSLAPSHPAAMGEDALSLPAAGPDIHEWRYLRRVGIGQPRLAAPLDLRLSRDVLPLARELGLRAITAARPLERYFFDTAKGTGFLTPGASWAVVLGRVLTTGNPHGAMEEGRWSLRFGLREDNPENGTLRTEMTVAVTRTGATLTGTPTVGGAPLPIRTDATLPASGSIDLRWEWTGVSFQLRWRRADWGDNWSAGLEWTAPTPSTTRLYVVVERVAAATSDPTFEMPQFARASGSSGPLNDGAALPDDPPLLVIPPDDPDRYFSLRPPGTDLQTWARWYDMDLYLGMAGTSASDRLETWTAYHQQLPAGPDAPATSPDLSFDDPAVAGVVFELVPLLVEPRDPTAAVRVESLFLPRRTTALPNAAVPHVQAMPWVVQRTLTASPAASRLTPVLAGASEPIGIAIAVAANEIWELRAHPAVAAVYFDRTAQRPGVQRFHSRFGEVITYDHQDTGTAATTTYRLFTPWRLVLEVAGREVIQFTPEETQALHLDDLDEDKRPAARTRIAATIGWHAVTASFDGRQVQARLEKLRSTPIVPVPRQGQPFPASINLRGDPWRFRYVAGVQLRRQVWRWRGRPTPPLPFAGAAERPDEFPLSPNDADSLMLWDAAGFGDRSGIDLLDEGRGVAASTPSAELFVENLTDDPRALYYRFNAQFTSRYAGLFPVDPPDVIAAQLVRVQVPDAQEHKWEDQTTPWRRLVISCRRTTPVPRPSVRFVVPLTQPADAQALPGACGLLVVLDEPAFAIGGLAEQIEAEVVRVLDPWNNGSLSRPQFGPDPTLRGQGWTRGAFEPAGPPPAPADADPPAVALPMDIVGPLGHTFDTDADAPLYVAASYFLHPPETGGIRGDDSLAWYFAKIRFRRLLRPEGLADQPALEAPIALPVGTGTDYSLGSLTGPDYVATVADLTIGRDTMDGSVPIELRDMATATSRGTVTISWAAHADPTRGHQVTIRLEDPVAEARFNANLRESRVRLDLRCVFHQEEAVGDDPTKLPPRHLAVSYRVHEPSAAPRANTWRILQTTPWPADQAWPDQVRLTPTRAGIEVRPVAPASISRVSRFTPPYWVQFLPDAGKLLPERAADHRIRWAPFDPALPNLTPEFGLLAPGASTPVDPTAQPGWALGPRNDWPPPIEQAETRFVRRLLLTELVRDVRGQAGQERYLGLYAPSGGRLTCLHRSPALAPREHEQNLARVRLRIVEFQVDKLRSDSADTWRWDELFGPDDPPLNRAADAPARVVRVSPPVNLLVEQPATARATATASVPTSTSPGERR